MKCSNEIACNFSKLSLSPKVSALESSLQQSLANLKDIVSGFEQLCIESEANKTELVALKQKCESERCSSAEVLKKVIAAKDDIIQRAASAITQLNETKNFAILKQIFQILCGDIVLSPLKNIEKPITKSEKKDEFTTAKCLSPKKELSSSLEDVSIDDESLSEIEGTPTGRRSPIILSRNQRSVTSGSLTDLREKKKCPEGWGTPESKAMKLHYSGVTSTKNGKRYRQARISISKPRPSNIVDLTSSPDCTFSDNVKAMKLHYSGVISTKNGKRYRQARISISKPRPSNIVDLTSSPDCTFSDNVKLIIRTESNDNDDTILPSPTSGSANFILSRTKEKQEKFKKPLSLKQKTEDNLKCHIQPNVENIKMNDITTTEMDESINILKANRFPRNIKKQSPIKVKVEPPEDRTNDEMESSISLLRDMDKQEFKSQILGSKHTPTKRPLNENINVANMPATQGDTEVSISLLREHKIQSDIGLSNVNKRKTPEKVEPVFKEPTVRKKAEKQALPAWVCDECRTFFGELYVDDPAMLAKVITRCGKHRGRNNPIKPGIPPGFWDPRWDVPEDTEEFNRMNNA